MTARTLSGRVALITGGASGIGRATAEALAAAGADIGIVDLDQDKATAAIEAITGAHGVKGTHAHADVADESEASAAHGAIIDALGPVTVLVPRAS
jgi:NAD(P)-dependent dehydrogenase (short-subunit alcohol dehydrogenase family)